MNTTYGALLNKYNDLFDPLMGRSVCITGQLFLLELAEHLYADIPGLKIVQLNTDGIIVESGTGQTLENWTKSVTNGNSGQDLSWKKIPL